MDAGHRNQPVCGRQWLLVGWLCCSAVAWAQPGASAPASVEYDRAVAAVEGRVITLSQLDFEARIILVNAGGVRAAVEPLDRAALESSLQVVIDQRLAVREADQLEAYPLEPGDLEKAIAAFRARFPGEQEFGEFLERHEASLDDLAVVLRRSLRAQRALDGKLRLKALVSESEAQRYQSEHPELKELPLEAVRQRLYAERFSVLVKVELKQARKTADVRLLGPFAPTARELTPAPSSAEQRRE